MIQKLNRKPATITVKLERGFRVTKMQLLLGFEPIVRGLVPLVDLERLMVTDDRRYTTKAGGQSQLRVILDDGFC